MRSPFQSSLWQSQYFACDSNDLEHFLDMFSEESNRLSMNKIVLGEAGRFPVTLYTSSVANADLPSVLICSGFHGDESAGPWGLLKWLMAQTPEIFSQMNLSILPLVNPTGFRKGKRVNRQGQDPFVGYLWEQGRAKAGEDIAEEGEFLLRHSQLLQAACRDGVLCCAESMGKDKAFMCSFEPRQAPGPVTQELQQVLSRYFDANLEADNQSCDLEQGNLFNCFDTSYTAMIVRSGARFGATVFTPESGEFDIRVQAHNELVQEFVSRYLQHLPLAS